jgi:hypothetical protein
MLIFVLQGVIINDYLYDFETGVAFEWAAILFRILEVPSSYPNMETSNNVWGSSWCSSVIPAKCRGHFHIASNSQFISQSSTDAWFGLLGD